MSPSKFLTSFLFCCLPMFLTAATSGRNTINTEDIRPGTISMAEWPASASLSKHERARISKEEKKLHREEKLTARLQKIVQAKFQKKKLGDLGDPVDKWFWIWAITWSLGIILTIIAGGAIAGTAIGIIWLASFVIGSVALILWLVKKFGQ